MEQKDIVEHELLMKGPGTFPLEKLLAIFQCIISVAEYSADKEELGHGGLGSGAGDGGLMSDVLLQLSSLCSANFISKGSSCPLEGSTRYRCTVDENMVLKVARSMKFPLSKSIRFENKDKSLDNTPALQNQAAIRQKLEGSQLRKQLRPMQNMADLTDKIRAQLQQEMDQKLDQKVQQMMKMLAANNPGLKLDTIEASEKSAEVSHGDDDDVSTD